MMQRPQWASIADPMWHVEVEVGQRWYMWLAHHQRGELTNALGSSIQPRNTVVVVSMQACEAHRSSPSKSSPRHNRKSHTHPAHIPFPIQPYARSRSMSPNLADLPPVRFPLFSWKAVIMSLRFSACTASVRSSTLPSTTSRHTVQARV